MSERDEDVERNKHMQAVMLTARLYECRDVAKLLLGDRFKAEMADWGAMIKKSADNQGISIIEEAQRMAEISRRKGDKPMVTAFILAAAVELIEPYDRAAGMGRE